MPPLLSSPTMTGLERFLSTFKGERPDSTPIWLMRQAGRYLPEYRELRARYGFKDLVRTPELATAVTLQPLQRFDLDAAIIFSDILVVPEAMGQPYYFKETKGIGMTYALGSQAAIDALNVEAAKEDLLYVKHALELTHKALNGSKALLGFGGAPWTLGAYMVEGASAPGFPKWLAFAREQEKCFALLMAKLCDVLIAYFKLQIEAGVNAIQIFDTWGSLLTNPQDYWQYSLKWIQAIIQALPPAVPIILFSKGCCAEPRLLLQTGARALSLDETISLKAVRESIPGNYILQGNIDPTLMCGNSADLVQAVHTLLASMQPYGRHILNLGHGMTPQSKIENVTVLIETTRQWHKENPL